MGKIIFVTGTDTGVGKTVLTASLLFHLRQQGVPALALKPFCSGGRQDALLLHALQAPDITLDEVNPFYFKKPIAPYLAASPAQRTGLQLSGVIKHIRNMAQRCTCLLVEGAGGIYVPVGEKWFIKDLIAALDCEVIVVSRDMLGTLNHTLLTIGALPKRITAGHCKVVLMQQRKSDYSSQTNAKFLADALAPMRVLRVRFLGAGAHRIESIGTHQKSLKKVLARLVV